MKKVSFLSFFVCILRMLVANNIFIFCSVSNALWLSWVEMGRDCLLFSSWLSTDSRGFPGVSSVKPIRSLMVKIAKIRSCFTRVLIQVRKSWQLALCQHRFPAAFHWGEQGTSVSFSCVPDQAGCDSKCLCAPRFQAVLGSWISVPSQFGKVLSLLQSAWECRAGTGDGRGLLAQLLQDYALLTLSFAAFCALNQTEGA